MPYGPGCWDTTQPHQVTSKLEEWNTGESRVSIRKDLNKPEEQASRNLVRFNKGKWSRALESAVPHVPGQAERWAQLEFGAHTTTAAHSLERLQGRAAEAIREPQHPGYKERQRPLPCFGWTQAGQDRMELQSSTTLIHWRRQTQTFLRGAQQKNKRQQSQAATREILIGKREKHHLSPTRASLRQGPKGAVQSSPLEIFKTSQGLEQLDLILKLVLLWAGVWNTDLQMCLPT